MSKHGSLENSVTGTIYLQHVKWCASFLCKLRGLMFRRRLARGEGLLMVEPLATKAGTAIHMLFMFFPIAAIWLDSDLTVVDKVYAKPWRFAYVPSAPAKYTLEAAPELLNAIQIGDHLSFVAD